MLVWGSALPPPPHNTLELGANIYLLVFKVAVPFTILHSHQQHIFFSSSASLPAPCISFILFCFLAIFIGISLYLIVV